MNCPWDNFLQVSSAFCERPLCAWIKEPANAWSNLLYILIGVRLWWLVRRDNLISLKMIGIVAIFTGIGSFFFHMSNTYLGGCTDYLGMFMGTGLLTAYNSQRLFNISRKTMYAIFLLTILGFFILIHLFPEDSRYLYAFGMPCCFLELILFIRDRKRTDYTHYLNAMLLISIGTLFWWLDTSKKLCDPDNHLLTGHAMWHFLTAAAFIPLHQFYKQFTTTSNV